VEPLPLVVPQAQLASGYPTGFYDVKCAEGFKCVSQVGVFGEGHTGLYSAPGVQLGGQLKDAYEWGCPARGVVSPAGECKDNGKGIQSMCYSTSRYEAGPDMPCDSEEKCFCVKPENSNGNAIMKFHHTEIKDGKVLVMGKFTKERENKCQECEQHDQDQKTCNECKNCEYFVDGPHKRCNRRVDLGIPKKQQDIPDTSERELKILPHFRPRGIWDPGEEDANIKDEMQPSEEQETTIQMPYTNRRGASHLPRPSGE